MKSLHILITSKITNKKWSIEDDGKSYPVPQSSALPTQVLIYPQIPSTIPLISFVSLRSSEICPDIGKMKAVEIRRLVCELNELDIEIRHMYLDVGWMYEYTSRKVASKNFFHFSNGFIYWTGFTILNWKDKWAIHRGNILE